MSNMTIGIRFETRGIDHTIIPSCALCGGGKSADGEVPIMFNPELLFIDPDGWGHIFGVCESCARGSTTMWDAAKSVSTG